MMRRGAPLIAGLVAVLVAGLTFFLLVLPKMREVDRTQTELDTARADRLALEAELARLRGLEERAPELRRELARLRREVPPIADLPGLINALQDIADQSGVEFFSVSPGSPTPSAGGNAAVIPAEIQVVGGFFSVDEFLFRLEEMNRAAKVTSIAVAPGGEEEDQVTTAATSLTVSLSVEFYTTDVNAGPGAAPTEATPSPEASPSPGATPSPDATPTPDGGG